MRALKWFCSAIDETREPETMTAKALDKLLSRFFKDIAKENGEEYEPSSLTSFQRSFQCYFSEKKLPFNISDLDDSVKVPSASSPGQTIATCQRNISQHCWTQHVACVWPPCCDMLGVVGSNLTSFKLEPTTPNMSQHIATRWPNARNMLRPTMLRYVVLACCDRLAEALDIQNAVTSVSSSYPSTSNALEAIFAGANISSVSDCTLQIMTGPVNIVKKQR